MIFDFKFEVKSEEVVIKTIKASVNDETPKSLRTLADAKFFS